MALLGFAFLETCLDYVLDVVDLAIFVALVYDLSDGFFGVRFDSRVGFFYNGIYYVFD
jgi:hypothetical protein